MKLKLLPVALAALTSLSAFADPIALGNAGFEADRSSAILFGHDGNLTYAYQPSSGVAWSFGGGTGVANSYSLLSAYEGVQFAFLQAATGPLSQQFNLGTDARVDLSFALALRPNYAAGQQVGVSVDGQQIALLAVDSTQWSLKSVDLGTLQAGSHTLAFQGTGNTSLGDTSAFIDAVHLNAAAVPEPASLALVLAGLGLVGVASRRKAG